MPCCGHEPQIMTSMLLLVGRVHCAAQRTALATSLLRSISTALRPQDSRPRPRHLTLLEKSSWCTYASSMGIVQVFIALGKHCTDPQQATSFLQSKRSLAHLSRTQKAPSTISPLFAFPQPSKHWTLDSRRLRVAGSVTMCHRSFRHAFKGAAQHFTASLHFSSSRHLPTDEHRPVRFAPDVQSRRLLMSWSSKAVSTSLPHFSAMQTICEAALWGAMAGTTMACVNTSGTAPGCGHLSPAQSM